MSPNSQKTKPGISRDEIENSSEEKQFQAPEGLWTKCPSCQTVLLDTQLRHHHFVCSECRHHFRMKAWDRLLWFCDESSVAEVDVKVHSDDPLRFVDSEPYSQRMKRARQKTGVMDAFRSVKGTLMGRPVQVGCFDFSFMGGSMGTTVGEKISRVFERALKHRQAAIVFSSSGGARMQEGLLSLMQMAKTTAALMQLQRAGLPFVSVLTDPTTGGVAASFAAIGDVVIAEPKALVGFAGPRVIQQTIRQELPEGFQRAEFLLDHGMIDRVVDRKDLRQTIANYLDLFMGP